MTVEEHLQNLEIRYREAHSDALRAKAHYLALLEKPAATSAAVRRARQRWESRDARKREVAGRMGEIEEWDVPLSNA